MTGSSSAPQGEHSPRPGTTWDTELRTVEVVVPDDDIEAEVPRPNRATRRAAARANPPEQHAGRSIKPASPERPTR